MSLYNNLNKQQQSEDLQDQTRSIRNDVTNKPVTSIGTRIADKAFDKVQTDRNLVQQYTGLSDFSGKETAMITAAMSNSDNPSETANKFMQALTYSHYKGIDFETAYNNLDALNAAQLNHKADYTLSTTESLRNSFQIGKLAEERNNLQAQFKQLDMAGQDTTEIVNQINAIDQKMYDLKDDTPRWITTKAAKLVGENWAYMKKVAVSGLTIGLGTALAATGVGAIAGVPMTTVAIGETASLTAMAYSAASTAGTIKGSSDWYENESYYKWRQKGVSKNTADWGSKLGGVVQGIIESALGASAKAMVLTGAQRIGVNLTDDFVRGISNAVGSRLNLSGTTEALLYSGLKYIADGNENGLEEVVQGGADNLASAIVYELDDIPVSEREYESLKDLGEEYIGGFLMGAFLDVPTIPVDFIKYKNNVDADASLMQTIKYVKYLKNDAQYIDSEKAFIDKHVEDSFLDPGVSESDKRNYLEKIWQKNHEEGVSETMTEAEAATYEVDTSINDAYDAEDNNGNPVEPQTSESLPAPKRLDDGRIRVQDSTKVSQNADGTETRVLNIGTTDSNRNYGSIKYTIDPQNQKITIDGVIQIIGQEDLAREGIIELARRNEGWEIEWNPTTTAQQKIKDQIINDPANTNKGKLNWFRSDKDVSTNVMVAQEIKKTFKNVSQKESIVMANLLQFKAEAEGKDLRAWMNDHVKSMSILTDAKNTKNVKGAIDLDEKAVKGVIWAGEKADFTTLEHEFFHLASVTDTKASANLANTLKEASNDPEFKKYLNSHRQIIKMDPDEAIEALKNIGTDPSKWNRAQKEITATLFESYQREGKTFNDKLKNLFEQIAEWFHRIYRTLKGENMLNDDIVKAYDAFFDKDASFREAAQKSEIKDQNQVLSSNEGNRITLNQAAQISFPQDFKENKEALEQFHKQYKKFDETKIYNKPDSFTVLKHTPLIFKELFSGHNDQPVYFLKNKTAKILKDHPGMTKGLIYKAISQSTDPVMVLKSSTYKNSFIELVSFPDKNGDPILMPIHFKQSQNGTYIDKIASVYGKDQNFASWFAGHQVVYVDEERSSIPALKQVQFSMLAAASNQNIITKTQIVNKYGLTSRVLYQVESEQFKNWFKDSKVVDENGNPKVVYHGSINSFDAFNNSETGIYFTDNKEAASSYGMYSEPYAVYLRIENPLELDFEGESDMEETASHYDILTEAKKAFSEGYDGLIVRNTFDGENELDQYVVKDNNQIKSATGNNGQFDPNNPNIYYQSAYHGSGAEFDQFLNSKINSGQGSQSFGYGHYFTSNDIVAKEYARLGQFTESQKETAIKTLENDIKDFDSQITRARKEYNALLDHNSPEYKAAYADALEKARKRIEKFDSGEIKETSLMYKKYKEAKDLGAEATANKIIEADIVRREVAIDDLLSKKETWESDLEAMKVKEPQSRNLYKVDIPDKGYIRWFEQLSFKNADKIVTEFNKRFPDKNLSYGMVPTGEIIYQQLKEKLGSPKAASEFLDSIGFIGIKYPAGRNFGLPAGVSGATNYVIFNPDNISIQKAWKYDTDEEATRFYQLENEIDDSYIQEAKSFDTRDEFISFEQTMGFGESLSEEKLGEYWDKAHGLYEVKKDPYKSPITEGMSDDEKDDVFKSIMSTDEGVKAFIENLREAASLKLDTKKNNGRIEAFSQDEYYDILQKIQNADLIDSLDYFISNLAYSTKELTPTQIKQVRTMINNSVRDYRSVYGQIIGDENFAVGVYAPVMPDIQDSRAAGMRIPQRKDLVKKLEGTQIREEVRKGTEKYDGTAEKVMAVYDQELKDLQAQYDKLKVDYDKTYLSLSVAQRDAFNKQEKIKKMESAIAKETRIVRNKLDAGLRADTTKLNNWQDELDLLHEEIKDLRKQEAVKSASEKKAALDALKQEIKDKQLEKAAVEEVHRYKRDLLSSIIAPVSNNVDYSYVEKINELRGMLGNVSGYQNDSITVDGKSMKLADFRKAIEDGTIKIEGLTDYQLKRYLNTSLADLTISDLETLKDTIDYYKQMGKQMWQAKVDKRHFEIQQMQNRFVADLMKNRHYKAPENLPNSVESQKANKGVMATLRLGLIKSLNMNRKFQMLANDTEGAIWQFAVQKKRDLQSQELAAKDARVNPLEAKRKELGVEWKEIYETIVPINLSVNGYNMNQNYTLSDLIYGLMAQKEDRNKQAFMYGDLVSANEKDDIKRRIGTDERANDYIKELGNKRNKLFVDQATAILEEHQNVMKLAEAYDADFQKQGKRLFDLSVEQYNKPMEQVEHYLPIMRQDFNGTDLAQKLADDLYNQNAGKGKTTPNKGMMKQRIDISPDHQTPTKLDFFNTWYESMNAQEHLIHTLGYSRDLNAVFKNYGSRELRSAIENTYGQGMLTDIDNYINEISNPNVFTDTQGINKIIKLLRGGEYTGYLGFKASSIVTQAITSPAAFLQYVSPAELVKGLMKMTSQPEKTWANICQLSPMMMHRSMDPVIDEIGKMTSEIGSSDIKKLYGKFLEIGTTGLEMIDRWAVAGGWLACYEKKLSEFEYQSDPKAIKEAVKYADKAVLDSQPVSDLTEIAPIFKSKSEFAKAFTKFQVSLNVIWNNVIYDNGIKAISNLRNSEIDTATKKQIFGKMVGCLAGYAFAGALLTMVQRGQKEDDDKEKVIKDLIYGMTTQFTSAVPFISSKVDNLVQSAITGEKGYEYSSSLYPALDKIFSGASSLVTLDKNDKDYEKRFKRSLLNITEGVALMGGAPTSGIKEIGYIFTKDGLRESIINGDAELTFNPGALLGQR